MQAGEAEFEEMLGVSPGQLPRSCLDIIAQGNFRYETLDPQSRDEVLLRVLEQLDTELPASGRDRRQQWEDGWAENLRLFMDSGGDPRALIPGYYKRGNTIFRLLGNWVRAESPEFEVNVLAVVRAWMAETFFGGVDSVYELGCGPGHNLCALAEMSPRKQFVGLDWATSSQEILRVLHTERGLPVEGRLFNMFAPDVDLEVPPSSAFFTFGALEQLGHEFEELLQFLIRKAPAACIHFEPVVECYRPEVLFDYVATKYHMKRGYLVGFLPRLQQLEKQGLLEILRVKRVFGGLYHDGWTNIVWRSASPDRDHD